MVKIQKFEKIFLKIEDFSKSKIFFEKSFSTVRVTFSQNLTCAQGILRELAYFFKHNIRNLIITTCNLGIGFVSYEEMA